MSVVRIVFKIIIIIIIIIILHMYVCVCDVANMAIRHQTGTESNFYQEYMLVNND
jgi:hypothetical protein